MGGEAIINENRDVQSAVVEREQKAQPFASAELTIETPVEVSAATTVIYSDVLKIWEPTLKDEYKLTRTLRTLPDENLSNLLDHGTLPGGRGDRDGYVYFPTPAASTALKEMLMDSYKIARALGTKNRAEASVPLRDGTTAIFMLEQKDAQPSPEAVGVRVVFSPEMSKKIFVMVRNADALRQKDQPEMLSPAEVAERVIQLIGKKYDFKFQARVEVLRQTPEEGSTVQIELTSSQNNAILGTNNLSKGVPYIWEGVFPIDQAAYSDSSSGDTILEQLLHSPPTAVASTS